MSDLETTLAQIQELRPRINAWMKARAGMEQRIWAFCARMVGRDKAEGLKNALLTGKDHSLRTESVEFGAMPLLECVHTLKQQENDQVKVLARLAGELPVADWWASEKGRGLPGLGKIIAETGDLNAYGNPAKLWKRMGVAVINGERQRKKSGDEALEHGYNPTRRSILWQIGDSLIRSENSYRVLYLVRMGIEADKAEAEGLIVATTTQQTVDSWVKRGLPIPARVTRLDPEAHRGCGHIHNRAKRYMEKRLLKDLWIEWRRATGVREEAA